jgi:hypothetical protein
MSSCAKAFSFYLGFRITRDYITYKLLPDMTIAEHHERYGWWLNELESLGINTILKHGLSNHKEASDLVEAVKQTLYEDYLQNYNENKR